MSTRVITMINSGNIPRAFLRMLEYIAQTSLQIRLCCLPDAPNLLHQAGCPPDLHRLWFGRCFAAEDQPYLDGCFAAEVQPYLDGVHGYRRVLSWAAGAMDPRMMRCLLAGPLLGGSLVAAGGSCLGVETGSGRRQGA